MSADEEEKMKNKKKKKNGDQEDPLSKKDYYQILDIGHLSILATQQDIKTAYRKLALKHHPDKIEG